MLVNRILKTTPVVIIAALLFVHVSNLPAAMSYFTAGDKSASFTVAMPEALPLQTYSIVDSVDRYVYDFIYNEDSFLQDFDISGFDENEGLDD